MPQLPPKPAEMSQETEEGAIATVRYFIDALNSAFEHVDPTRVDGLYDENCESCLAITSGIEESADQSWTYSGYELSLGKILRSGEMDDKYYAVKSEVLQGTVTVVDKAGKVVRQTEQEPMSESVFVLEYRTGTWIVMEVVK